jgi:hypothetical protein
MADSPNYRMPPNDPNRPIEPQTPVNADHSSPVVSALALIVIVAVVLLGGWAISNYDFGTTAANQIKQLAAPAAPPSQTTTGAAVR